jgi:hypothetical protein
LGQNARAFGGQARGTYFVRFLFQSHSIVCPVGDDDIRVLDPRHHAAYRGSSRPILITMPVSNFPLL